MRRLTLSAVIFVAAFVAILADSSPVVAQRIFAEAVAGTPFGVGRITVPGLKDVPGDPWADGRIDIFDRDGRLLYPVYSDGPVRQILRQFVQLPEGITIYFLFQGDAPLDVTVTTPAATTVAVQPRRFQPNLHRRLQTQWWREYSRAAVRNSRASDYPGVVGTYLTSTLARRLALQPPNLIPRGPLRPAADDGMELLMGTERMKTLIQQQSLAGNGFGDLIDVRRLGDQAPRLPLDYPPTPDDVGIEHIAMHVPADCLYLRCGTFANYVWMQVLMEEWGGEIRNMVSSRGVDYGINDRMEALLGLKETVLSRTLGGAIISDVAIIGADPFFREGPATGMLFEASNRFLLNKSILKQREDAVAKYDGAARIITIQVEGVPVSYASSTNGSLRSYYVADGKYHLVTTSKSVVADFLKVARNGGKGSLGQSPGFRYARSLVPVDRGDTLFLYLSDEFHQRLASPQYRIEMGRRLRSITDMSSLRLARWAAMAEGQTAHSIDELIAADLLPAEFARRADASQLVADGDQLVDSARGLVGTFVPVPDMPIDKVSESEARDYGRFVDQYAASPSQMDPIILAVRRSATGQKDLEHVTIDALIAPLRAPQYQRFAKFLGAPREHRIARVDGDLLRIDGIGPRNNYLFLGIQDFNPPLAVQNGRLRWTLPNFNSARGYLGGSPGLGLLESILSWATGGPAGPPTPSGDIAWPLGLWQRSSAAMTVLSFDRAILEWVTPQLTFQPLENPAQIHLDVADLSQTRLAGALNALGYQRARDVSIGNTAFLQSLARQLRVPPEKCFEVARDLVHADIVCALDGDYQLQASPGGRKTWVSTAWSGENQHALAEIPADYVFPVMTWFRGMNAQAAVRHDIASVQANLLIQRHPKLLNFNLPDLFKSPPAPPLDAPETVLPEVVVPPGGIPEVQIPKAQIPDVQQPESQPPAVEELPPPRPILPEASP